MGLKQLYIGLFTEGITDEAFLSSVVERTFAKIIREETNVDIEICLFTIKIDKSGLNFKEQVLEASKMGLAEYGISILCVHTDADDTTATQSYTTKINPAKVALTTANPQMYCNIMVAIVPIQEMEAWLLADKLLLKEEIGTDESDNQLGIHKHPEKISNPKEVIESAIRIDRQSLTKKRRRELKIADLYLPIGQQISLEKLMELQSFQDFQHNIREALKELNLLY